MSNPFNSSSSSTTTQYISTPPDKTSSTIKYTNSPTYIPKLSPGELAYNYMTKTLLIGAINPSDSPINVVAFNNSFEQFLISEIDINVSNKVPTARAVRLELNKKADLTHSNQFTGMNEFPYLRIRDAAPAQQDIAVTIRMLREYIEGGNWNHLRTNQVIHNYSFTSYSSPSTLEWILNHNENTTDFIFSMKANGINQYPMYEIVDPNNIKFIFTTPTAGTAMVTFYV